MTRTDLKKAYEAFLARGKEIQESTYLSIVKETSAEQEQRIKMLLKPENYVKFFDYYFGLHSGDPLADAPCADFHQSSYEKVYANPFIKQLRMWYRGAAKSIHTNVGNMLHLKQNDELYFGLIIGQNEPHAQLLLSDIQVHLEYNEKFIKDFGVQKIYGSWSGGEFQTKDGRFFKGLGIDQPFRGLRKGKHRIDFVSLDDVEDRKIAKKKERVQERGEKITGDIVKAFGLHRGRFIMPNNYIVKDGLIDYLRKEWKKNPNLSISKVNLTDEYGNPSWHQRISKEKAAAINADTDYYTSQREDYNNPIEKGKRFKEEWIRFEKVPPIEEFFLFVGYWDLSYKREGDFKAYAVIGVANGKMYVLHVFCRQCEVTEAVKWHYDLVQELAIQGIKVMNYFDATASQGIVHSPVFQQESLRRHFFEVPIEDHSQHGDKHNRIDTTLTNVFFNKTLVFADYLEGTEDMEAAKTQLLSFQKGTTSPDDFPDALENAVRKVQVYALEGGDISEDTEPIIQPHEPSGY
ncbi:conserved hypothetical protein [Tenacibaculum sp. 190524A02b]|uniref:Terminase n=1 Tax=Tenacibaculum vairaonense TaxID=3137860 RepID=A0ABM9PQY0_9FLAO